MTCFPAEAGLYKKSREILGQGGTDDPGPQYQNIHIVVLDALSRGVGVVAQAGADAYATRYGFAEVWIRYNRMACAEIGVGSVTEITRSGSGIADTSVSWIQPAAGSSRNCTE